MARHGIAGLTVGICTLVFGAGCFYLQEKFPIALDQGDVTGVVVGTPPNALSRQKIVGARVRVRGSAMVRTTNTDGRFVVRNLPAGNHLLEISFDQNRDGVTDLGKLVRVPVRVMGGRRSAMDLGEVELLKPGNVVGNIGPSTDAPFDNVMVNLFQENPGVPGSFELTDLRLFAQANGDFDIAGVGEGSWEVQAARAGVGTNAARIAVVPETPAAAGTLLLDQPNTGRISGSLLPPVENTELSGVGVVTQGLDGFDGVVLLRLTSTTNPQATPLEFELNERDIDVGPIPADVYTVEIDFPPNERTPDPVNAYLDVSFPFVVVAGRPCNLGQLIASRLPPPSRECPGGDQDGDGQCFAGDLHCAADCRAGAASCVEDGKRWDCDDDGDGQADVVEMLGDSMSGPCRCGVTGPRPLGTPSCEQDAFRADQDFDGICDLFDRFPACALNRFPCQADLPDAGVPDAAMPDAATPDAAQPPDGAVVVDASVPPDAALPPDAGTPDAALPPDAAGPFGFTELKEVAYVPGYDGGSAGSGVASLNSLTAPVAGGGSVHQMRSSESLAFLNAGCATLIGQDDGKGFGNAEAIVRVDANGQCLWRKEFGSAGTQLGVFFLNGLASGSGRIYAAFRTSGGLVLDGVAVVSSNVRGFVLVAFPDTGAATPVETRTLLEFPAGPATADAYEVLSVDATTRDVTALIAIPPELGLFPGLTTVQGYGLMVLSEDLATLRRPIAALYPPGPTASGLFVGGAPHPETALSGGVWSGSLDFGTLDTLGDGGLAVTQADGGAGALGGQGLFQWDPQGAPVVLPLRTQTLTGDLAGAPRVLPGPAGLDVVDTLWETQLLLSSDTSTLVPFRAGESAYAAHLNGSAVGHVVDFYNSPAPSTGGGRLLGPQNVFHAVRTTNGDLVVANGLYRIQRVGMQQPGMTPTSELWLRAPASAVGTVVGLTRLNGAGEVIQHAVAYAMDANSRVVVQGARATADNAVILTLAISGTVHVQQQACDGTPIPSTVESFNSSGQTSLVFWRVVAPAAASNCAYSAAVNPQMPDPPGLTLGTPANALPQTLLADVGPAGDEDCVGVMAAAGVVARMRTTAGCTPDMLFDVYRNPDVWTWERTVGCGEHALNVGSLAAVCVRGFSGVPAGPVTVALDDYPAPANDTCMGAQDLVTNNPTDIATPVVDIPVKTWNADASFPTPFCATNAGGAVFYRFTAARSGRLSLSLTPGPATTQGFTPLFTVYQDCGIPQLETACDISPSFNVDAMQNYIVAVRGNNGTQGETTIRMAFEPSAPNDFCANTQPLGSINATTNQLEVPFSFVRATGEYDGGNSDFPCGSQFPPYQDLFYTFSTTAQQDGVLVLDYSGSSYLAGSVHLFDGTMCVNQTEDTCSYLGFANTPLPVAPNTTYNLVLTSDNDFDEETGTLRFDFVSRPTNDLCASDTGVGTLSAATPLLTRNASNYATNGEGFFSSCGAGLPTESDVYFSFVAGETGLARVRVDSTLNALGVSVLDLSSFGCGMPSELRCNPANQDGIPFPVVQGRTYHVLVYGNAPENQARFDLTVERVVAPANDVCGLATPITVGQLATPLMSSNLGAQGEYNPAPTSCSEPPFGPEPDSFFLLSTTLNGQLQVRVSNLGGNVQLMAYLLDDASCTNGNGTCAALPANQWTTVGLLFAGNDKHLAIKGLFAADQATFDLEVRVVSDNIATDVCGGTNDIVQQYGNSGVMGGLLPYNHNYDATALSLPGPSCTGYPSPGSDGVVTATVGPMQRLTLVYESSNDSSLYVLDGCPDTGPAACVAGADDAAGTETLTVDNNSANPVTYVIILDQYSLVGPFEYALSWNITNL